MTHLNIQQGLNIEVVTTLIIKKLYEAALSVPEPLEGELDAAYMSGNLLIYRTYRTYVSYLTGRFNDLHINVTDSYYIPFEDGAVLNALLANNIGFDGIGVTEAEAANATFTMGFFENNTDITSFNTFNLFTKANTNPPIALFRGCTNLASVNLSNITTISEREFHTCKNLNVSLNLSGLTSLGYGSFCGSGITSITNLGSITSIPNECFRGCKSLTSVTLPSTVTSIYKQGFADCHMTTMDLSHVTSIGEEAFINSYLTTADLSNVTSIGPSAFKGSRLTGTLNLQNLTGTLGTLSFGNTGISSISSLGSVTEIGESVFLNTNISSITIPNSVKKCACNIVNNTIVPEIIFPEGVEEIYDGLIRTKNNSLTYIEIPSTVTKMGAFFHMSLDNSQDNLCTVVIKATTPPELNYYNNISYTRGNKFAGIYVPDNSLTAYQNGANVWLHSSIQAKLKPISQLLTDNPTAWAKYNRTSTV